MVLIRRAKEWKKTDSRIENLGNSNNNDKLLILIKVKKCMQRLQVLYLFSKMLCTLFKSYLKASFASVIRRDFKNIAIDDDEDRFVRKCCL